MLRPFEQLRHPKIESQLISGDAEKAALIGGGQSYSTPWHWHDCLMFMLPSHGTLELKNDGQKEGSWLTNDRFAVIPPGCAHSTKAGLGTNGHIAFYVTSHALERLSRDLGSLRDFDRRVNAPLQVRRSPALRALQELAMREDFNPAGRSAIRQNLSSALLLQCISDVLESAPLSRASKSEHGMALVSDVKAYLADNLDREVLIEDLAERFGISRRHITRLFREGTGQSIGEYQIRIRLNQAIDMLRESDLPVGEIAFRVGFDSGAAFARAMRRVLDQSPSDIRAEMARLIKNQGPFGGGNRGQWQLN